MYRYSPRAKELSCIHAFGINKQPPSVTEMLHLTTKWGKTLKEHRDYVRARDFLFWQCSASHKVFICFSFTPCDLLPILTFLAPCRVAQIVVDNCGISDFLSSSQHYPK